MDYLNGRCAIDSLSYVHNSNLNKPYNVSIMHSSVVAIIFVGLFVTFAHCDEKQVVSEYIIKQGITIISPNLLSDEELFS